MQVYLAYYLHRFGTSLIAIPDPSHPSQDSSLSPSQPYHTITITTFILEFSLPSLVPIICTKFPVLRRYFLQVRQVPIKHTCTHAPPLHGYVAICLPPRMYIGRV